jgi:hypothetical protein
MRSSMLETLLHEFEVQATADSNTQVWSRFADGNMAVWDYVLPLMRKAAAGTLTDDDLEYANIPSAAADEHREQQ